MQLKLKTFPATRAIPLGCYAESVSSVTYRVADETRRYRDVLLYVRDEEGQSVVRDKAGQLWPQDATDVVIEFTPREWSGIDLSPEPDDTVDDFDPRAGDEPADE